MSLASDFKKVDAAAPPNASESVAVPLNFTEDTELDNWIPCATAEKPAAMSATAFVSELLGVNARLEITPTTTSCVTNFNIDLFTPELSKTVSGKICVTPEPAMVVGPISDHAVPV